MESNNMKHLSKGEPTYWPSDRNKQPDLTDFCVTKGISQDFAVAKSCLDLYSDHSPVLSRRQTTKLKQQPYKLGLLQTPYQQEINVNLSLKTEEDIEAGVKFFNDTMQWEGWNATPEHRYN
jgi:hypothetical protein